jgi:ABC-type multidrug transport system fused ATPase/permease subunit
VVGETGGGLDADIAELPLSHGQKQMFCLARAMLGRSKILILDEAGSGMDVEMEGLMKDILAKEFGDCTVLAVVHRMDVVEGLDRILVMDGGKVESFGVPTLPRV